MASLSTEISRIAKYFAPLTRAETGAFNLSNDAAALKIPAGKHLIITTDSCIEGVHLPRGCSLAQLARKGFRRNLSDLAAMGAQPWRYTLNLHLHNHTADGEIAKLASVLAEEQAQFDCVLIGGDCTSDDARAHLTFTMLGVCDHHGHPRGGANSGDDLYVSGTIGDGFLGLQEALVTTHHSPLTTHYYAPKPQLALGMALHKIATSCIDISDGLLADMRRLEASSGKRFALSEHAVPLSEAALFALQQNTVTLQQLLSWGDDYELLFTAPKSAAHALQQLAQHHRVRITKIGDVN